MTLVVGIRCTDGVVVGSDSAMTFGPNAQQPTIEQRNREKIHIVDGRIIVAGTGYIGFGQRFTETTERLWREKQFQNKSTIEIGRLVSRNVIQDFSSTNMNPGGYGALVAVPNGRTAELIEFPLENLQPEVKSDVNWYASMGIGQLVADPLLGFVRAVFWGDEPPNRQEGVFAATLVLKLACQMSPVGVAEPIQMAILYPNKKGQLSARQLTEEELLEHKEVVSGAIEHFKQYRSKLAGQDEPAEAPPAAPGAEE